MFFLQPPLKLLATINQTKVYIYSGRFKGPIQCLRINAKINGLYRSTGVWLVTQHWDTEWSILSPWHTYNPMDDVGCAATLQYYLGI